MLNIKIKENNDRESSILFRVYGQFYDYLDFICVPLEMNSLQNVDWYVINIEVNAHKHE